MNAAKSIKIKIIKPTELMFKLFLFIFAAVFIATASFQVMKSKNRTNHFLSEMIEKTSRNAEAEGTLIFLQRQVDQIRNSLEDSGIVRSRVDVFIDSRPVVMSGQVAEAAPAFKLQRSLILPSGSKLEVVVSLDVFNLIASEVYLFALATLVFLPLTLYLKWKTRNALLSISDPLEKLTSDLAHDDWAGQPRNYKKFMDSDLIEINDLGAAFEQFRMRIVETESKIEKLKRAEALDLISRQVAHDIRSPLSALTMATAHLSEVSEERRLLIRNAVSRINDIANSLLKQGARSREHVGSAQDSLAAVDANLAMLAPAVDAIVSEKRIEYRDRMAVEIFADLREGYGLFARLNATELSRAVSNLINNAVEAFDGAGQVRISLRPVGNQVEISIADNGKGMSPEVLSRIGERGFTHGKAGAGSGSGLGIFQAKSTIEKAGGVFEVSSELAVGTKVTMRLPRADTPNWFLATLKLNAGGIVVSVDDDQTIHQIWAGRLKSACDGKQRPVEHVRLSTPGQLVAAVKNLPTTNIVYLVDYEFLEHRESGLDLVAKLKLAANAILVTSRYEEPQVRERAQSLGVKILPKGLAPLVPIEISGADIRHNLKAPKEIVSAVGRDFAL